MSRMLEALKQIEAKRSNQQSTVEKAPAAEDHPGVCVPVRRSENTEAQSHHTTTDPYDSECSELHPIIQEELDELRRSAITAQEPVSSPAAVQSALTEASAIEKTLARAESAVTSALSTEEPGLYGEMAQYILARLTSGRPHALLFTAPDDIAEKTETLIELSTALVDIYRGEVLVLDADFDGPNFTRSLSNNAGVRYEKMPRVFGDWGPLLAQLKERYRLVLINAPSLANIETAPMISSCDGVYLMIGLGYTTPHDVRESVCVIQRAGGRLLGSIAVGEKSV